MSDKTLVFIIAGIVFLHLIVGFGWIIYKMNFSKEAKKKQEKDSTDSI